MASTETMFNIPCREGSLDVIVKGDSSFADVDSTHDSSVLVSPPKVFIHCTCGALHSPPGNGENTARLTSTVSADGLLKKAPQADDLSFHPNISPRTTSSPIKPTSGNTKKTPTTNSSAPELHYHEHYHYVDDDDYEGYTSDLNEHVVASGNEKKRNKLLSKSLNGMKNGSSNDNNGFKVTFVSFLAIICLPVRFCFCSLSLCGCLIVPE